jgi:hypothetical protein
MFFLLFPVEGNSATNIECSLFRGVFMCDQRNFHVKRKQK